MDKVKFLLVAENLISYIVTTPFEQVCDLVAWLEGIRGNVCFSEDPIAWLPPGSFANIIITEDEILDLPKDTRTAILSECDEMLRECHGTLMVDDNDSVFYWVRDSKNIEEWKLPSMLVKGA
jgi:hypothetical protein